MTVQLHWEITLLAAVNGGQAWISDHGTYGLAEDVTPDRQAIRNEVMGHALKTFERNTGTVPRTPSVMFFALTRNDLQDLL